MSSLRAAAVAIRAVMACVVVVSTAVAAAAQSSAEIDRQVWQPLAASVTHDDIEAMGRAYHPDAVVVTKDGTQPIAAALDRWGRDMVIAKQKGVRASVAFRFTMRQDGPTTAFESGAFRYATTDKAGTETPGYVRFEALLVKTSSGWRVVMERQLDAITEAAWHALPH
jgi:ketosteroid isomerase-like protein